MTENPTVICFSWKVQYKIACVYPSHECSILCMMKFIIVYEWRWCSGRITYNSSLTRQTCTNGYTSNTSSSISITPAQLRLIDSWLDLKHTLHTVYTPEQLLVRLQWCILMWVLGVSELFWAQSMDLRSLVPWPGNEARICAIRGLRCAKRASGALRNDDCPLNRRTAQSTDLRAIHELALAYRGSAHLLLPL